MAASALAETTPSVTARSAAGTPSLAAAIRPAHGALRPPPSASARRPTAGRWSRMRRPGSRIARVAHVDGDVLERDVELLADHLRDGGMQAVAHVHLAEEGRHAAVGADRDIAVELLGMQRRLGALRQRLAGRLDEVEADGAADRDDERACAGALEQAAAASDRCDILRAYPWFVSPLTSSSPRRS